MTKPSAVIERLVNKPYFEAEDLDRQYLTQAGYILLFGRLVYPAWYYTDNEPRYAFTVHFTEYLWYNPTLANGSEPPVTYRQALTWTEVEALTFWDGKDEAPLNNDQRAALGLPPVVTLELNSNELNSNSNELELNSKELSVPVVPTPVKRNSESSKSKSKVSTPTLENKVVTHESI